MPECRCRIRYDPGGTGSVQCHGALPCSRAGEIQILNPRTNHVVKLACQQTVSVDSDPRARRGLLCRRDGRRQHSGLTESAPQERPQALQAPPYCAEIYAQTKALSGGEGSKPRAQENFATEIGAQIPCQSKAMHPAPVAEESSQTWARPAGAPERCGDRWDGPRRATTECAPADGAASVHSAYISSPCPRPASATGYRRQAGSRGESRRIFRLVERVAEQLCLPVADL